MDTQPEPTDQSEQITAILTQLATVQQDLADLRTQRAHNLRQTRIVTSNRARVLRGAFVAILLTAVLGTDLTRPSNNALASVPDAGNVYHGCLSPQTFCQGAPSFRAEGNGCHAARMCPCRACDRWNDRVRQSPHRRTERTGAPWADAASSGG